MGQLYSHLVFRPPSVCTYQNQNGFIKYVIPDNEGLPRIHSAPLIWLLNSMRFRIPCVMIRQPQSEFVAIYAHQNGEDLGTSVRDAHLISHSLGIDVLAFEYSGYGLSERPRRINSDLSRISSGIAVKPSEQDADRQRAEPSEKACCSDINAAFQYLTEQCNIPPSKIIVFGRSIGSGPAVYCAATRKVGGLILIAPIASAVRVPLKHLNVTLPFIDTFPNIDRASKIRCPVLVIHGDMDELVPKLHAEKLFAKIKQNGNAVNPLWIPDANHNNVVEDFQSIVFGRYSAFLEEIKSMDSDKHSADGSLKKERSYFPLFLFLRDAEPGSRTSHSHLHRRRTGFSCLHVPRDSIDSLNPNVHITESKHCSRQSPSSLKTWRSAVTRSFAYDNPHDISVCKSNETENTHYNDTAVNVLAASPLTTPKRTRSMKMSVLESRAKTHPTARRCESSVHTIPSNFVMPTLPTNEPQEPDFDKSVSTWLEQFKIAEDATLQMNPTWDELQHSIQDLSKVRQKKPACVAV